MAATTHDSSSAPAVDHASADPFWQSRWFLPLSVLLMNLVLFAPVLFGMGHAVVSDSGKDLALEFGYWRQFGFEQLRHGHLALWNPYVFSGTPFMGGWQAALLYPPDWIYLVLPVDRAINVEIALHVFFAGLGTALWTRHHGLHPVACLLAATMVMFGGPFFLHVMAGHLATVDTMCWIPFVLLAVDGLFDYFGDANASAGRPANSAGGTSATRTPRGKRAKQQSVASNDNATGGGSKSPPAEGQITPVRGGPVRWMLLAAVMLALQVLAGHPQTLFNTVVTIVIYVIARLIPAPKQWPAAAWLAGAGIVAVLLTCAQIVLGLAAAAEGTRRGAIPYEFASMFSFPPENFLTAVVPNFFGGSQGILYWGRCYLWEMCLFSGVTGLILAIYGLAKGSSRLRSTWLIMVVALLWIALADHTPLFAFLYHFVPGFDRFRSHSKFIFEAALFLAMAAAQGMDTLLKRATDRQSLFVWTAGFAGVLALFGLVFVAAGVGDPHGWWQQTIFGVFKHGESSLPEGIYKDPIFIGKSQLAAGFGLLASAAVAAMVAALLFGARKRPQLVYAIALVGIVELFAFARTYLPTYDPSAVKSPMIAEVTHQDAGDYRVLQLGIDGVNDTIGSTTGDIWGYDPTVLGRYAEYMTFTQNQKPSAADMYLTFSKPSPLMQLFRMKYALVTAGDKHQIQPMPWPTLPHALLVQSASYIPNRDAIFAAISAPGFDFNKTVILDTPGIPSPDPGATGTVTVTQDYPGRLTLHADVSANTIALITDTYSRDWQATPLEGSSQTAYRVVPADYAALAIPLSAGKHVIRLEYVPAGFAIGAWVSEISTLVVLAALVLFVVGPLRFRLSASSPEFAADYVPAPALPRTWGIGLGVALITYFVFAQAIGFKFVNWDDNAHLVDNALMYPNPSLAELWSKPVNYLYVPIAYTFWAFLVAGVGRTLLPYTNPGYPSPIMLDPAAFHGATLLLHVLNTVLVYFLIRRFIKNDLASAAGALLFGLHPMQAESVAWVSETRGTLSAFLGLIAIHLYLQATTDVQVGKRGNPKAGAGANAIGFFIAAGACFVAALLSKPSVATLPLVVLLIDLLLRKRPIVKSIIPVGVSLVVAAAIVLGTQSAQPVAEAVKAASHKLSVVVGSDALAFYLGKLFLPWRLAPDYGRTPMWLAQHSWAPATLLVVVALAGVAWFAWKRWPVVTLGIGIFVVALLPVLGLVPFTYQSYSTVADRYAYLALIGPAFIVAWLVQRFSQPQAEQASASSPGEGQITPVGGGPSGFIPVGSGVGVLYGAGGILAVLAIVAYVQCSYWSTSFTLFKHELKVNNNSALAYENLATSYGNDGKSDIAINYFTKAIALDPTDHETYRNLGSMYFTSQRLPEAIDAFRHSIALDDNDPATHNYLGSALALSNSFPDAKAEFDKAIAINPDFEPAERNAAVTDVTLSQYNDAVTTARKAIALAPTDAAAHKALSDALGKLGQTDESAKEAATVQSLTGAK